MADQSEVDLHHWLLFLSLQAGALVPLDLSPFKLNENF